MEARLIEDAGAPAFLRLLCDIFNLDHDRAKSIFFSEPLYALRDKWGLWEGSELVSILTVTPLLFGWGPAIGIAGVGTRPDLVGLGYAGRLLQHVLRHAESSGQGPAMLFAHDTRLYERLGFDLVDTVVRGKIHGDGTACGGRILDDDEVAAKYSAWAERSRDRLVRDDARWRFWRWSLRTCEAFGDGYVSLEPSLVREAICEPGQAAWPVPHGTEWYGLHSLTEELGVPLESSSSELLVMSRNFPTRPVMHMTDQF